MKTADDDVESSSVHSLWIESSHQLSNVLRISRKIQKIVCIRSSRDKLTITISWHFVYWFGCRIYNSKRITTRLRIEWMLNLDQIFLRNVSLFHILLESIKFLGRWMKMKKSLLFHPKHLKNFFFYIFLLLACLLCTSTTQQMLHELTAMTKIERFHLVFWISLNLNFFYFSWIWILFRFFSFACYLFSSSHSLSLSLSALLV